MLFCYFYLSQQSSSSFHCYLFKLFREIIFRNHLMGALPVHRNLHLWFPSNCLKATDQGFNSLVLLLFSITAVRHNIHFEFGRVLIQTSLKSLISPHRHSSTKSHLTHTLPLSQEETNDIVLVEKYWHPGHALFIVYFKQGKQNNCLKRMLQMGSQNWDDIIKWD